MNMYIYRVTFGSVPDFGFSMAISLFRSVVNCIFLAVEKAVHGQRIGNQAGHNHPRQEIGKGEYGLRGLFRGVERHHLSGGPLRD